MWVAKQLAEGAIVQAELDFLWKTFWLDILKPRGNGQLALMSISFQMLIIWLCMIMMDDCVRLRHYSEKYFPFHLDAATIIICVQQQYIRWLQRATVCSSETESEYVQMNICSFKLSYCFRYDCCAGTFKRKEKKYMATSANKHTRKNTRISLTKTRAQTF